jgi:hypothetical protein
MTEPNEPDKKDNETESTNDEAIIELKEEITDARTGDEEIIDLLEATEEQEPLEDEAIIELKEEAVEEPTGDEEIIDLLEAAEESPKENQDESVSTEEQKPTEDDSYIDLTATISESPREVEDIGEPVADDADLSQEFDDIDELDNDLIKETDDFTDEFDMTAIMDKASDEDFADSLGIELDSKEDLSGDLFEPDSITNQKIEAALERVIKKVFYEKIDRLLEEAIEKTVKKEIEKLKKALLEDSPGGEK